jgi:PHD/YefM family antitoxin component YafN of YafNO toxin-antitoxin module
MDKVIDFNEAQDRFDELLDKVENSEYFVIKKDGITMAAMISYEEYQKHVETRAEKRTENP